MKNKFIYSEIIIYFIFMILFLIRPYYELSFETITSLLFLKLDYFQKLNLDKLPIKYLIGFIIFLYITFYQRLSIIYENNTYFSMVIHKMNKKDYNKHLFLKNVKDFIYLWLSTVMIIFIIFHFNQRYLNYNMVIHMIIYLFKYYSLLFSITYIYQMKSTIKNNSYFLILLYCLLICFLMIDMSFQTHIITLSDSLNNEVLWLLILCIINLLFILMTRFQFLKAKEIYND